MDISFDLSKVDFRTTPIENIFLDTYLSHAPADALRVYLAGWKMAGDKNETAEGMELAATLGLSDEAFQEAMDYWKGEGLVSEVPDAPGHYQFHSMLLLWAGVEPSAPKPARRQDPADFRRGEAGEAARETETPELSRTMLFDALEEVLSEGRSYQVRLKDNEIRLIQDLLDRYPFTPAYFLYAYKKAQSRKDASSRSVNYVAAVVENWARFDGVTTVDALDALLSKEEAAVPEAGASRRPKKTRARQTRKHAAYVEHDTRMTREEQQEMVRRKLEEARARDLRGGTDHAGE